MDSVEQYLLGLKNAYFDTGANEAWEHFQKVKNGATKEDIENLKNIFFYLNKIPPVTN